MFAHWFFPTVFLVMWAGWLVLWRAMAFNVKAVARSESLGSRLSHLAPLVLAGYLLAAPHVPLAALNQRFVSLAIWPAALGVALTFAGAAFSIWARFMIADNWSSDVQLKRDHELIVAGPYALVRHPIYTGLLLMFVGTALAVGEWRGVLGSRSPPPRSGASLSSRNRSCGSSSARLTPATPRARPRSCRS